DVVANNRVFRRNLRRTPRTRQTEGRWPESLLPRHHARVWRLSQPCKRKFVHMSTFEHLKAAIDAQEGVRNECPLVSMAGGSQRHQTSVPIEPPARSYSQGIEASWLRRSIRHGPRRLPPD